MRILPATSLVLAAVAFGIGALALSVPLVNAATASAAAATSADSTAAMFDSERGGTPEDVRPTGRTFAHSQRAAALRRVTPGAGGRRITEANGNIRTDIGNSSWTQ